MKKNFFLQKKLNDSGKKKQFADMSIYTTTLYGKDEISKVRQKLAEKFLENADKLGIKCLIVDSGSNKEFLEKAGSYKNVELVLNKKLKMGASRREALRMAMKKPSILYFLWSEPEKHNLIKQNLLKEMIEGLRKDKTDIVVPRRLSKKSYPKFQAKIETKANKRAKELMGDDFLIEGELDLWFGPKMFNRAGAQFFLNYKGRLDKWDAIIKPVVQACRKGKRISSVDIDYTHDILQTSAETGDRLVEQKRLEQYELVLAELENDY